MPESFKMTSINISGEFVPKMLPQLLATLAVATSSFSLGTVLVWTSPSIPDFEQKQVLGALSIEDKSWIASLVPLGALLCGPFSGYIIDKCGRRIGLMIFAIIMALGWSLISTGLSITIMCVGRFLTGFALGGNTHLTSVYVAEISEEKIRGFLMSITYIECGLGILYIYILGTFASWFTLSVTNIFFPVFLFVSLCFVPESPIHLINKGKKKEAGGALMWLRGADNFNQIESELNKLQDAAQNSGSAEDSTIQGSFVTKNNAKALGILLALMMCQQLSGVNAVLFYTLYIFQTAGTNMDPNLCSIIIGIVILFAVFLNLVLIDRLGRRVLLITSELGMTISLLCLGIFFYLKKENDGMTPSGLSLLPLLSLIAFMVTYNIGAGPVPMLMMGELLPPRIKTFGCSFATSFNWVLAYLVTKYFESLTILLEIYMCYFIFSGICFIGLIFCAFCVPETRGKSLDEIQKLHFSK